jgi:hypothetical protein
MRRNPEKYSALVYHNNYNQFIIIINRQRQQ